MYVSIHAASQEACALYWLSQNSSRPGVIVCLCVTDTSKNREKTGLGTTSCLRAKPPAHGVVSLYDYS